MQLRSVLMIADENLTNMRRLFAAVFLQLKCWPAVLSQFNATLHVPTSMICDWLQINGCVEGLPQPRRRAAEAGEIRVHGCSDANLHALQ
jgi:hypothetical protein